MDVFIVRHGSTVSNHESKYYGFYESELSGEGYEEIGFVKAYLSTYQFDCIFSSDKKRALETAKGIIGTEDIAKDARLSERNFGIFENKTYEEIKKDYPQQLKKWEEDWKGYIIPEGESFFQCYRRTKTFMKQLEKINADRILLVTHGGIIRNMLCYVLNDQEDLFWRFAPDNGDVVILKYKDSHWYIDCIEHIGKNKKRVD